MSAIHAKLVNVYVLDSGILTSHNEFPKGRAIYGKNIRNPRKPPIDCDGHGTHVAATAVGKLSGVASNGRAISVKILNCSGRGSCSNVLSALEWVAEDSTRRRDMYGERSVAIMSIGSRSSDCAPTLEAAKVLWDSGVFIAAAAGNDRGDACQTYPARSTSTFAVGAFDIKDRMYFRNNVGPCVDIFAPGVRILAGWGANSTSELRRKSGSSMAAPIVAAIAAVILGVEPNMTSDEVKEVITSSSTKGKMYDPSGTSLLTGVTNEMVFAPWSKLFEELQMDEPEGTTVEHGEEIGSSVPNDSYWNSSTSYAAFFVNLHPRTRPAMLFSAERIKRSLSQVSGIRDSAILPRLQAGQDGNPDSNEPTMIRLVFYVPMMASLVETYRSRILRAATSGDLRRRSNETISFDSPVQNAFRRNISVPAARAAVLGNDRQRAVWHSIGEWIKLVLLGAGSVAAALFLFGGLLLIRKSLRSLRSTSPSVTKGTCYPTTEMNC